MNTIEQLLKLQEEVHRTNVEKGFWEDKEYRNKGEAIMLMITELSEAVEIHRKGLKGIDWSPTNILKLNSTVGTPAFTEVYNILVKNTVEEELADTAIRILDYCAGFDYKLTEADCPYLIGDNFAENMLGITKRLCHAALFGQTNPGKELSRALNYLCDFCEASNIDLVQHVEWKMRYNKQRPHKHGKQY